MIRIKPHHFVDIVTAFGDGQTRFEPHPYGHAVHTVAEEVHRDHEVLLEMELGADDICAPCSHNVDGICDDCIDTSFRPRAPKSKREYNLLIDERWCRLLGIAQGDRLTARELCRRIRDRGDDLAVVYREMPSHSIEDRRIKLTKGVRKYLEDDPE